MLGRRAGPGWSHSIRQADGLLADIMTGLPVLLQLVNSSNIRANWLKTKAYSPGWATVVPLGKRNKSQKSVGGRKMFPSRPSVKAPNAFFFFLSLFFFPL
jgi:hypothetical protein